MTEKNSDQRPPLTAAKGVDELIKKLIEIGFDRHSAEANVADPRFRGATLGGQFYPNPNYVPDRRASDVRARDLLLGRLYEGDHATPDGQAQIEFVGRGMRAIEAERRIARIVREFEDPSPHYDEDGTKDPLERLIPPGRDPLDALADFLSNCYDDAEDGDDRWDIGRMSNALGNLREQREGSPS